MKKLAIMMGILMLLTGCVTVFKSIVTITEIRTSVMNELGKQYRAGNISPELDKKISELDLQYLKAAKACERALALYKAGEGTEADYISAFRSVKVIVDEIIDLSINQLGTKDAEQYKEQLKTATEL